MRALRAELRPGDPGGGRPPEPGCGRTRTTPAPKGYACRKGLKVIYHQYPADRLTQPLKRVGREFQPISWEQAISEIAGRLKDLVGHYGPRCLAYMGGGAPGGNFEASFGVRLLRALGSQYYYSSTGQEFSGHWWVHGRMLGRQYNVTVPDEHRSEMLLAWGWNGMMSHQMPRARAGAQRVQQGPRAHAGGGGPPQERDRGHRGHAPGPQAGQRRPAAKGHDRPVAGKRLGRRGLPGPPGAGLGPGQALVHRI